MTPTEFVQTPEWRHLSRDINLEVAAVCLPLVIYVVALGFGEFGLDGFVREEIELLKILKIPDAFFGSTILFCLSIIRIVSMKRRITDDKSELLENISKISMLSWVGIFISTLGAGLCVMFHPDWALIGGLITLFVGYHFYKRSCLYSALADLGL